MHMTECDMDIVGIGLCWRVVSFNETDGKFSGSEGAVAEFLEDCTTGPLGKETVCVIGSDTLFVSTCFGWHGLVAPLTGVSTAGFRCICGHCVTAPQLYNYSVVIACNDSFDPL